MSAKCRYHDLKVSLVPHEPTKRFCGTIQIGEHPSPFGLCRIALAAGNQIAHLSFDEESKGLSLEAMIERTWSGAVVEQNHETTAAQVEAIFGRSGGPYQVLVRGTPFQLRVWRALLTIPAGTVVSYGAISKKIGAVRAARAVGRAVGANPVALLIPCHRVVRGDGRLGGYRWGLERKRALLLREGLTSVPFA
ncbi:MAG: methylated-DNA--[protein]-cysteine S-methyltransferase [Coraliomargaritaceae bacterium]